MEKNSKAINNMLELKIILGQPLGLSVRTLFLKGKSKGLSQIFLALIFVTRFWYFMEIFKSKGREGSLCRKRH